MNSHAIPLFLYEKKSRPPPSGASLGGVPFLRIKNYKTKTNTDRFAIICMQSHAIPLSISRTPTFRDVPIFLRKSYHTDYIDVVPPQKNHKTKKIQQSSQYIACIYYGCYRHSSLDSTKKSSTQSNSRHQSNASTANLHLAQCPRVHSLEPFYRLVD